MELLKNENFYKIDVLQRSQRQVVVLEVAVATVAAYAADAVDAAVAAMVAVAKGST